MFPEVLFWLGLASGISVAIFSGTTTGHDKIGVAALPFVFLAAAAVALLLGY